METLDSIIVGYTNAIAIVHLEIQNKYKLKVKSLRIKNLIVNGFTTRCKQNYIQADIYKLILHIIKLYK